MLGRRIRHDLNALNGFSRKLTKYLGAVVIVHPHLFAIYPHKDIGIATQ